ncbi:hypothetical protein QNK12_23200 [Neobacillus cucumis]|nr:hypothetical protein QNK12_23200 [Neobacillus cucumis]
MWVDVELILLLTAIRLFMSMRLLPSIEEIVEFASDFSVKVLLSLPMIQHGIKVSTYSAWKYVDSRIEAADLGKEQNLLVHKNGQNLSCI